MADGNQRNAGRIHPPGGMRRRRRSDPDGSSRIGQDPQSVPGQRQRLRAQQVSGPSVDTQKLMMPVGGLACRRLRSSSSSRSSWTACVTDVTTWHLQPLWNVEHLATYSPSVRPYCGTVSPSRGMFLFSRN